MLLPSPFPLPPTPVAQSALDEKARTISFFSATMVVVANMIGSGIFVTTGWLVPSLPSHLGLLLVWVGGGLLALCGALSYGELASYMPRSGGEYQYLSRIYHPAAGFISGFISLVVGFAAPIALTSITFGSYVAQVLPIGTTLDAKIYGSALILGLTALHTLQIKYGASAQNVFTVVKVGLILFLIVAGLLTPNAHPLDLGFTEKNTDLILSAAFALGLIQVYFAYSGWNAAAYLSGEIRNPRRNVPLALFTGTVVVTVLYILLTFVFLRTVPLDQMAAGGKEVGHMAADAIFGKFGYLVALLISFALVSSVSSMIMAGPRVTQAIGEDFNAFALVAKKNNNGVPVVAILLQTALALFMLFAVNPLQILIYVGFTLSLSAMMSVLGVFILRSKYPNVQRPYKTWGYPVTPALFVLLCLWMIYNSLVGDVWVAVAGFGTMFVGFVIYLLTSRQGVNIADREPLGDAQPTAPKNH